MNTKRLLKLADFLETVPRRSFDIRTWTKRKATKPEGDTPGECGFAGCAMGWAAHARLFPGLRLNETSYAGEPVVKIRGQQFLGFDAAVVVFDISSYDAKDLFSPLFYPNEHGTPKQVAKKIRKFVESNL